MTRAQPECDPEEPFVTHCHLSYYSIVNIFTFVSLQSRLSNAPSNKVKAKYHRR